MPRTPNAQAKCELSFKNDSIITFESKRKLNNITIRITITTSSKRFFFQGLGSSDKSDEHFEVQFLLSIILSDIS